MARMVDITNMNLKLGIEYAYMGISVVIVS